MGWMDGWMGWLSYTAVTPRASLQSDANNWCDTIGYKPLYPLDLKLT